MGKQKRGTIKKTVKSLLVCNHKMRVFDYTLPYDEYQNLATFICYVKGKQDSHNKLNSADIPVNYRG
jgi:hypothetical protein